MVLIDPKCGSLFLDSVFCSVYLFALFCALTYYPDFYSFPSLFIFCHAIGHMVSWLPCQGSDLLPLHWKVGVLTTGPPGTSLMSSLENLFIFSKIVVVILDPFHFTQILESACQFCQQNYLGFDADCIKSVDEF